jgi:DNA-binding NarL/FixJ family response regulator
VEALREVEQMAGTAPLRACADRAEGMLAAARGEHEQARPLLEDAVDRFRESGAPYEAALAGLELATSLLAAGRPDAARREAGSALDRLVELGANAAAEQARRLVDAAAGDGPPLREITRREHEVLCLLTEGLTNRQIAERLTVSEHTVHRHVTNILRKLDLPSRTAAAAYAARAELLARAGG